MCSAFFYQKNIKIDKQPGRHLKALHSMHKQISWFSKVFKQIYAIERWMVRISQVILNNLVILNSLFQ